MTSNYPTQDAIAVPLLQIIASRGGEVDISIVGDDIERELADHFQLSSEQKSATSESVNAKGRRIWRNDIQWARARLVERGEMDNSVRGRWKLTQAGYRRLRISPPLEAVVTSGAARLTEEIDDSGSLIEGAVMRISVNAYERNPIARKSCIEHYGAICVVCNFNFGSIYGPSADGYIHVHHLKPLSEIGIDYEVDPIMDLRPVCPNCHAVIHLGGECRSIEEVRELIR